MATLALKNSPLRAGPGGRSSVSGATATVFGATGKEGRGCSVPALFRSCLWCGF